MDAEYWEQMKPRFLKPDAVEKPLAIDDDYPAVPSEIKNLPQWVLWNYEVRAGKQTKIPKQTTGANAKANTPSTWTDYHTACTAHHNGQFEGIGFVFTETDIYLGIDLDNCIVDGKVSDWAQAIIDVFKNCAYIEVSPSGTGLKFWTRAQLPPQSNHKFYFDTDTGAAIECYESGRYFTVTGKGKFQIDEGQDAVNWLVERYLKKETPPPTTPPVNDTRDTTDIKHLIENSRQRGKYHALMAGNWQTQGYGSRSEGDYGLISLLCFWTQDARYLDAIFRKSELYRPKWDEKHRADGATYGEMTIEKALAQPREKYTPRKTKKRRKRRDTFYEARAKRRRYR